MATNKNATLRYHTLDKCFSNFGRYYTIDDLVDACNEALYEFNGLTAGVKKRQVYDDILFMKSEQGWSIELEKKKVGRQIAYRYVNKSFSIKNQPLTAYEKQHLTSTFQLLSRFKGMPQFDWLQEADARLRENTQSTAEVKISFAENPYLKGMEHFSAVYDAVLNETSLHIVYQGYKQSEVQSFQFFPYYLKQYNNRWFLFGRNAKYKNISNLALDRIVSISPSFSKFEPNTQFDFGDYFEDVIGVSIPRNEKPEKVILKISDKVVPYIASKPIHGSQILRKTQDGNFVELYVYLNFELKSYILSQGKDMEVIHPAKLRTEIIESLLENIHQYKSFKK